MIKLRAFGVLAILSILPPAQPLAYGGEGREIAAPPWSAACMTDQGPIDCGEPMWIYGGGEPHARDDIHLNGFVARRSPRFSRPELVHRFGHKAGRQAQMQLRHREASVKANVDR